MSFSLNFFLLIFLLGAAHGILHTVVLLFQKNRNPQRLIFSLFILSISLACLKTALQEVFPVFWSRFPVPLLFQFAWGPLLLLYTQSTLYQAFHLQRAHIALFVPSLLFDVFFRIVSQQVSIDADLRGDISLLIDAIFAVHFSYLCPSVNRHPEAIPEGLGWVLF